MQASICSSLLTDIAPHGTPAPCAHRTSCVWIQKDQYDLNDDWAIEEVDNNNNSSSIQKGEFNEEHSNGWGKTVWTLKVDPAKATSSVLLS